MSALTEEMVRRPEVHPVGLLIELVAAALLTEMEIREWEVPNEAPDLDDHQGLIRNAMSAGFISGLHRSLELLNELVMETGTC